MRFISLGSEKAEGAPDASVPSASTRCGRWCRAVYSTGFEVQTEAMSPTCLAKHCSVRLAHERVSATLMGLSQLEKQVLDANAKFKGKARQAGTRQTKRVEALEIQRDETLKILESGSKRSDVCRVLG